MFFVDFIDSSTQPTCWQDKQINYLATHQMLSNAQSKPAAERTIFWLSLIVTDKNRGGMGERRQSISVIDLLT